MNNNIKFEDFVPGILVYHPEARNGKVTSIEPKKFLVEFEPSSEGKEPNKLYFLKDNCESSFYNWNKLVITGKMQLSNNDEKTTIEGHNWRNNWMISSQPNEENMISEEIELDELIFTEEFQETTKDNIKQVLEHNGIETLTGDYDIDNEEGGIIVLCYNTCLIVLNSNYEIIIYFDNPKWLDHLQLETGKLYPLHIEPEFDFMQYLLDNNFYIKGNEVRYKGTSTADWDYPFIGYFSNDNPYFVFLRRTYTLTKANADLFIEIAQTIFSKLEEFQ